MAILYIHNLTEWMLYGAAIFHELFISLLSVGSAVGDTEDRPAHDHSLSPSHSGTALFTGLTCECVKEFTDCSPCESISFARFSSLFWYSVRCRDHSLPNVILMSPVVRRQNELVDGKREREAAVRVMFPAIGEAAVTNARHTPRHSAPVIWRHIIVSLPGRRWARTVHHLG